ncbi:5'-deoxynucleotidase [Alteromonas aestuariivivens]|uniref:5'-deoxynucleotidase n=1 Tax=Alteromonas aestuariivivens TaxID=1938339 RepID=A0A3D8M4F0_9ALTE|nr:5'-deoxynucleotidase [Alteromonas aestuariivivens]RDV24450.1 5'-deoxynucleotidase [Alteromonas aestuariivivens]
MAKIHSSFIGLTQRARNVKRWPLMAQFQEEMLSTHIYEAATVAHMLGAIAADVFGEAVNPDRVASMALFHEGSEIAGMSDIPSPVKYHDPETTSAIKKLEKRFENMLIQTLPQQLQARYRPLIEQDKEDIHVRLAKAADVLCAYLKCDYELSKSNSEFANAMQEMEVQLGTYRNQFPCVDYFCQVFLQDAKGTLDEQTRNMDWIERANTLHLED